MDRVSEKKETLGHDLLWKRVDVKELFQTFGLWPVFIGVAVDFSHEEKVGKLPVAVTIEQRIYISELKEKQSVNNSSSSSSNSRKRKRSNEDDNNIDSRDTSNDTNDNLFYSKRTKTSLFSSISSIPFHLFEMISQVIPPLFDIFSNYNDDSKSHLVSPKLSHRNDFRREIFFTLKRQGFFVGPGGNYGGDYTLYVGKSPADSHSSATVRVCDRRDGKMSLKDLVTLSRVQTQVNKTAVLAFPSKQYSKQLSCPIFPSFSSETNIQHSIPSSNITESLDHRFLRLNFKDVARRL